MIPNESITAPIAPTFTTRMSSSTYLATGSDLHFRVDPDTEVLELELSDGTRVDLWEQTLAFGFDPQQSTVQLHFHPIASSYALSGQRNGPAGSTVLLHDGDDAVDTLVRPSPLEATLEYVVHQVEPRSSSGGPSVVKLLKARLVLTTTTSDADPDGGNRPPPPPDPKE